MSKSISSSGCFHTTTPQVNPSLCSPPQSHGDHPGLCVSVQGVCRNRSLHSSPPPRSVQRLSQQTSCASLVPPGCLSAFRLRVQVSTPQVPGLKIEHDCVDQNHSDRSNRWGLSTQAHPNLLTMRFACLKRVALTRAVVSCTLLCRHRLSGAMNFTLQCNQISRSLWRL